MTNGKTNETPKGLNDQELDRVGGGSIELENIIISSLKDDRKPRENGFSWGVTQEGTF